MERPVRLRFKLPMFPGETIIINNEKSDYYLEFVLDKNDELRNGRFVIVSKDRPKIRFEKNLELEGAGVNNKNFLFACRIWLITIKRMWRKYRHEKRQ